MWNTLKISTLGLSSCRLGVAGFLLFFSLWASSAQASISLSSVSAPVMPEMDQGEYPENPEQKKIDLTKLSDEEFMMEQANALAEWIKYSVSQKNWNKKDQNWKKSLMTWWDDLKIWLQKREDEHQKELKQKDDENIAMSLENESLRQQLKTAQGERWLFGLAGIGIGAGGVAIISLVK